MFFRELLAIGIILVFAGLALAALFFVGNFLYDTLHSKKVDTPPITDTVQSLQADIPPADTEVEKLVVYPPEAYVEESKRNHFLAGFSRDTFAELQAILSNLSVHCPNSGDCKVNNFLLHPININADNKNGFIVSHSDYCGAGGCTTLLMSESADKTWESLDSTFGNIEVLLTLTGGYRDIQNIYKIYLVEGGWYEEAQKLSWNGSGYIVNGKPKALPQCC